MNQSHFARLGSLPARPIRARVGGSTQHVRRRGRITAIPLRACLAWPFLTAAVFSALPSTATAQTTLGGGVGTTWRNTTAHSTGSGLTLNLGLGVEYLIIGGGGGGGNGFHGGGGGAGGMLEGSTVIGLTNQAIVVGGGGAGGGNNGGNSSAFAALAIGGGGGGNGASGAGRAGGSGGGASYVQGASGSSVGGTGTANYITNVYASGAGGGGAGGAGGNSTQSAAAGAGGTGKASSITGSSVNYAGGGGGNNGTGGTGGGGSSGAQGTDGLGGGGGGIGSPSPGGRGGAGRVAMRYLGTSSVTSGGSTSFIAGTDWQVVQFTTSGTSQLNDTLSFTANASGLVATQSGTISGTGSLTYDSPGTLTLGTANTHTGSTFVKAGTLNLGHVNALQSSTLDMLATDVGTVGFTVAGTNTYAIGSLSGSRNVAIGSNTVAVGGNNASTTYSGVLSGNGSLRKSGLGSLTLSGGNEYTGGTVFASGTLALGANERLADTGSVAQSGGVLDLGGFTETVGSITMSGGVMRNGAITATGVAATAGTIDGALAGTTALTKSGAGELSIRGANAHSGGTVISAGLLVAESNAAFGSGGVELGAARLRFGDGVVIGNGLTLTSAASATAMDINAVSIQYLVVGGGGGGAGLEGAGGGGGGGGNVVAESTTLASRQTAVVVGAGGAAGGNGGVAGGASSVSNPLTVVTAVGGAGGGYDFTGGTIGGSSSSTIDGVTTSYTGGSANSTAARGAGGGGAAAGANGTNAAANTGGTGGAGVASAISGPSTYYSGGGGGGAEYAGSTPTPGAGGLGGGGRGAGSVSGQTGFIASVAGTPNTGGGGGGAGGVNNVASGYNGAAGGSGVAIIRYAGPQIATGGTVTTVGGDTVHTFTTASDALTFTSVPTARLNGIVGGTGGFTWSSFGNLTLVGANTYQGGTIIYDGGVYAGQDTAFGTGTVTIAAAGATLGAAANVLIANPIALDAAGVFDSGAFAATVSGAITGTGALTKSGHGTLTLVGTNAYTGVTTISSGTLRVGAGGTVGEVGGTGNIANDGVLAINRSTAFLLSRVITGSGGFQQIGSGTTTLTNANTYTGMTTISAGRLIGTTTSLPGPIANDSQLEFAQASAGTFASAISGTGSLTKSAAGVLTLTAANTYSGPTTILAGTLQVGNGGTTGSLGAGNVVNDAALVFNRSNDLTVANAISGAGSLTKQAAGVLTLSSSNAYSGGTTLTAGALRLQHASALGTGSLTQASGASTIVVDVAGTIANDMSLFNVRFDRNATLAGGLTLNGATFDVTTGVSATASGLVSGAGGLTKTGAGTLTISGSNAFAGDTALTGGTLVLGHANALGNSRVLAMQPGTTLTLNQRTYVGDVDQFGGTINGTEELVTTLFRTSSGTIAAPIADADGGVARGIRKITSGTTTVTAANTFTGTARVEAGTLALGSGGSFAAGSTAELFAGGTLDLAGRSQTFAGVSGTAGTIALGAGSVTVNAAAVNTFGGEITGSGGLTKTGGGNLILSGSSAYTGATSVAAGRLSVDGILGDSPIAVLAAAERGGSGSIAGAVSVAAGGTLSPGNSIASLATGTASFAAAATFAYEVDSTNPLSVGAAADLLVVSGNLNLDPGNATLLTFADIASSVQPFVKDATIFALINYSGPWNGGLFTYGGNVLADGSQFSVGSQRWEIDYNRTSSAGLDNFTADYLPSSSFVTVMAVPEPGTLALVGIGTGLAALAAVAFRRM